MPSPQVAEVVEQLRAAPVVAQLREKPYPIEAGRIGFDGFQDWIPVAKDVAVEKVDADGVPCEWITAPGADTSRAVLFFHGGCYIIGSVNSHRELCGRISRATGAAVLLVDYRRAPEHPCPAASDDCLTAFAWLEKRGIPASRIALAGDSAGGGLTVATMVRRRDAKKPLPACGVVFSPWVDLECTGKEPPVPDLVLRTADLRYLGCYYLGDASPRDPIASPLYADLEGIAPLSVQVGSAEVLLDDSYRLVERLKAAGVETKLQVWDGLFHVFQLYPSLPEADEALRQMAEFMRAHVR